MDAALQEISEQALALHSRDPGAASRTLARGLPLLAQAEAAELEAWLRAAEHVVLGHLDDAPTLKRWVAEASQQWPRLHSLGPSLQRVEAAMTLAEGSDALLEGLLPAERVRAHYNALLACARRGDWANARLLLELATARAAVEEDDASTQRALAALCDNVASDLREHGPADDADATALMLDAATRGRVAWARLGGWLQIERADWQLAMCLAHAGQGALALQHAREGLRACEANGADDYEFCFAWQAMAHARLAAGERDAARLARDHMRQRRDRLSSDADRAYADQCLAWLQRQLG